ncbi:TSUP family transporter, partial [Acinetobacter baumannii]
MPSTFTKKHFLNNRSHLKNMSISTLVILLIIGICAGMLSGLVGVGGGIIIVPALIFF